MPVERGLHGPGHGDQAFVAGQMSQGIIVIFEQIHIDHQHAHRSATAALRQTRVKAAPVGHAGQSVHQTEALVFVFFLLQRAGARGQIFQVAAQAGHEIQQLLQLTDAHRRQRLGRAAEADLAQFLGSQGNGREDMPVQHRHCPQHHDRQQGDGNVKAVPHAAGFGPQALHAGVGALEFLIGSGVAQILKGGVQAPPEHQRLLVGRTFLVPGPPHHTQVALKGRAVLTQRGGEVCTAAESQHRFEALPSPFILGHVLFPKGRGDVARTVRGFKGVHDSDGQLQSRQYGGQAQFVQMQRV